MNKKNVKCVFRFILDICISADLEWWKCVGFFAHLPDEDCVVKCGLCSVCVTSLANPYSHSFTHVVQTNTELCLCHWRLGCSYICLAIHPPTVPVCFLENYFLIKMNLKKNLHSKSGLIAEHIKRCSVLFLLLSFCRDCMNIQKICEMCSNWHMHFRLF